MLAEREGDHTTHRCRDPATERRSRWVVARRRCRRSWQQLGERHRHAAPARCRCRWSTHARGTSPERSAPTRRRRWHGSASSTPAGLGGCLALDMGLGKTPTVLAHLARTAGDGTTLVIAPAAVVGNWAAEAARFAPGLRVSRSPRRCSRHATRAREGDRRRRHDRSRPTRPRFATSTRWLRADGRTIVLDEAQAIKNPASETAQQLRRITARTRLALTGTPIENGWRPLGDPRFHQSRPRRLAGGVHRPDVRRRRGRAARAQRRLAVPSHQERARGRRRAPRQDRRARPLHDDARADRSVPGRARRARPEVADPVARRDEEGRDPGGDHGAEADLQPSRRVPRRRPAAGRTIRQAGPTRGDRRVRSSTPASAS